MQVMRVAAGQTKQKGDADDFKKDESGRMIIEVRNNGPGLPQQGLPQCAIKALSVHTWGRCQAGRCLECRKKR